MNEGIIKLLFKQVRSSVYKFFGKRIKKAINRDWLGLNDEELKELGYEEMYEYLKEITKFTARYHYFVTKELAEELKNVANAGRIMNLKSRRKIKENWGYDDKHI